MERGLFLHHACHRHLVFALLDRLSLVVFLLTMGYSDDKFCKSAVVDEQSERDDGKSGLLAVFFEFRDFFFVEQEFAVATGRV